MVQCGHFEGLVESLAVSPGASEVVVEEVPVAPLGSSSGGACSTTSGCVGAVGSCRIEALGGFQIFMGVSLI